jgi:hypothetical protein
LRQHETDFQHRNIDVAVVTFDADVMAKNYVKQTQLPWPLLIDADQSVYRAYRLDRGDWWSIYGPAAILGHMKLIFLHGRSIQRPGSDFRQLGGDILIDPEGIVRFHYASVSPHDRPSVAEILKFSEQP